MVCLSRLLSFACCSPSRSSAMPPPPRSRTSSSSSATTRDTRTSAASARPNIKTPQHRPHGRRRHAVYRLLFGLLRLLRLAGRPAHGLLPAADSHAGRARSAHEDGPASRRGDDRRHAQDERATPPPASASGTSATRPKRCRPSQGFDSYLGIPYSNDMARQKGWGNDPADLDKIWTLKKWDIYNNELYRDTEEHRVAGQPDDAHRPLHGRGCLEFIRTNKEQPFFLYFASSMPHVPLFVSDERYDPDPHQAYKLTIEHIDASVGRMLKLLDELGIADNTFIVYTSDNGPWLPQEAPRRQRAAAAGRQRNDVRRGHARALRDALAGPDQARPDVQPGGGHDRPAADVRRHRRRRTAEGSSDRRPRHLRPARTIPRPRRRTTRRATSTTRTTSPRRCASASGSCISSRQPELYDLRADIGEANNVAEANPDVVKRLRDVAEKYDADLQANSRPAWKAGM